MRFKILVGYQLGINTKNDTHTWTEEYDRPEITNADEAFAWGIETIAKFNAGLRPHETPRRMIRAEMVGPSLQHDGEKMNLVTLEDPETGGFYDSYRCKRCGAMGKRWGLDPDIEWRNPTCTEE